MLQFRGASQRIAVALALTAIVVVLFARQLFFDQTFSLRDHLQLTLPMREYLGQALRAGRIPEWAGIGLGMPFAANPSNMVAYPPAWLGALVPAPLAVDLLLAAHLVAAALGMAALARRLGADGFGQVLGGAAFVCSGYVTSTLQNGVPLYTVAWLPWVAWAVDRVVAGEGEGPPPWPERLRAGWLLSALLAGQIASGDPAANVTSALLAGAVLVVRGRRRWPAAAVLAGAAGFALLLAAVALLPAGFLFQVSERAAGLSDAHANLWSTHPLRMLEMLWPQAMGSRMEGQLSLTRVFANSGDGGLGPTWAPSVYLGVPAIGLALVGAYQRRELRWLLVASGLLVALALGSYSPLYGWYRSVFPPERLLRFPEKHLLGAHLLLALLAGVGLTSSRTIGSARLLKGWGIAAGAMALLAALGLLLRTSIQSVLAGRAGVAVPPLDLPNALELSLGSAWAEAGLVLAAGLVLGWPAPPRWRWMGPSAAVALIAARLVLDSWQTSPVLARDTIRSAPRVLQPALGPASPGDRLFRPEAFGASPPLEEIGAWHHELGQANIPHRFGLEVIPGYSGAQSSRYVQLNGRALNEGMSLTAYANLLGIRFLLLPDRIANRLPMRTLARSEAGWSLLENEERRPRAFVASRWRWMSEQESMNRLIVDRSRGRDRGFITLSGEGQDSALGVVEDPGLEPLSPCEIQAGNPEHLRLSCDSRQGGWLTVLQENSPGWAATVDGVPTAISTADALMQAVPVRAGAHAIELRFQTPGLRLGAGISLAAWVSWALAGLALRLRRQRQPARAEQ